MRESNRASRRFAAGLLALLGLSLSAGIALGGRRPGEQLVIFVASEGQTAETFETKHLPQLRAAAEALELPVRVVNVSKGAPAEVELTPLLVFQDHRGRVIFQARYVDAGKLTHFIRTNRVIPLDRAELIKRDVAVLDQGRGFTLHGLLSVPVGRG